MVTSMKRITGIRLVSLLVALCALVLVGCAAWDGESSSTQSRQVTQEQQQETEATEESQGKTESTDEQGDSPTDTDDETTDPEKLGATERGPTVTEDGRYTSKEEVALYIHTYGHLPSNFISKTKARKRGWNSKAGNLDEVCPGMSIGGSEFYNDDGQLPDARGRTWKECDIDYTGGYRGAERIVFSNDGLIFYTADHYKTFEQLY